MAGEERGAGSGGGPTSTRRPWGVTRPHRGPAARRRPDPQPALPRRNRPIASVDFAALRRRQPRPLLAEAEERVAGLAAAEADVLVHGDLWQGNALWRGDSLAGLVDWDCAGVGPPGVDLGSLRCDAAVCFGMEAADDVRRGSEEEAGRPDLTRGVLVRRRDAFLRGALGRLDAGRG